MDRRTVLALYDQQIRRDPTPDTPNGRIERDGEVTRCVSDDGWAGVTWCGPDHADVDAVIAAQVERFAAAGRPWEWKHYSYDRPASLPERLIAAGFTAQPAETLLVAEITELAIEPSPPSGMRLSAVADARDVAELVSVHDEVFGGDHSESGRALVADLHRQPRAVEGVLAVAGGGLSPKAGSSFPRARTLPGSGAGRRCPPGAVEACSGRWSRIASRSPQPGDTAISRSTPPRRARRSFVVSASWNWPPRPRSATAETRPDLGDQRTPGPRSRSDAEPWRPAGTGQAGAIRSPACRGERGVLDFGEPRPLDPDPDPDPDPERSTGCRTEHGGPAGSARWDDERPPEATWTTVTGYDGAPGLSRSREPPCRAGGGRAGWRPPRQSDPIRRAS
ncbi:hypothetical protein [Actinoalloteichus fjordicus]|uniref:Uncharacterized protein n=1 Tax=Actinoalloteichus fjordicus TaxID=1612552 RepID=A0AAC9LBT3_9PSEU|nr:hypothetical protein [Actinoalloteichus fjordicus]APU15063.1 hypothetical protein UA74_15040 [Actinoalloteichus fjordicus]